VIRQPGTVLRVEGEVAWVECARGAPCAVCPGAGACQVSGRGAGTRHRLRARVTSPGLGAGAEVVVGIPPGAILHAALLAYGVPLSALLAGAGLGSALGPVFGWAGAGAGLLAGVAAGAAAARRCRAEVPVILGPLDRP
jgi:sigma-E factor negative regulatory protein RseC